MSDIYIHELGDYTSDSEGYIAVDDGTETGKIQIGLLPLDTSATSGTDKELYDALVDLGWTDCIV